MASRPLLGLLLACTLLTALRCLTGRQEVFVGPRAPIPHCSRTIVAATSESSLSLPVYEETVDNKGSASVVFCFVLGLVFPVIHGFTFALLLAAVGYGLWKGGVQGFVAKSEATKEYAGYVEKLAEASLTAGEYSLKAYNFVATKSKELAA
eukprot:CAMPEP_0171090164 /NCGR_PEP_ID=MMETSP0766_2-20121228/29276_1 /TAXON_ID=439317 /ORGANISM="Gambierdiscus australes, Strain CAWD 149" /LENGTH=150 /DNA_ID=CAMNT_0011548127 /DNA_START=56 /DNA_END=508 /DNA_ORIENTATION=+